MQMRHVLSSAFEKLAGLASYYLKPPQVKKIVADTKLVYCIWFIADRFSFLGFEAHFFFLVAFTLLLCRTDNDEERNIFVADITHVFH